MVEATPWPVLARKTTEHILEGRNVQGSKKESWSSTNPANTQIAFGANPPPRTSPPSWSSAQREKT